MNKKEIIKSVLSSHMFWALVSFVFVLLFTGLTQNEYDWSWKTTSLVISCVLFILFGLGAVGLSVFNSIIRLIRKIKKK